MKFLIGFLLITIVAACSEPARQTKTVSAKEKFDAIEKIVGNANWQLTVKTPAVSDTSFIYFSRTGDDHFNIYWYKMEKGDSVSSVLFNIVYLNDSTFLQSKYGPLFVKSINDTSITLQDPINAKSDLTIVKKDSSQMIITDAARGISVMKKTLPLGVFLVRKKYDYLNGTSYADSAEIAPRPIRKSN